jgi:hypothetical protein
MNNLPVAPPHTPYDWLAIKETYRERLEALGYDDLSILYGLSSLAPFRDEPFCRQVEASLDANPDPVCARYEFGYHLASSLWETFWLWEEELKALGDSGEFPAKLKDQSMQWLLAGIPHLREDGDMLQLIHWLKYRRGMSDTSLSAEDIQTLEAAMGYTIDFRSDQRAQALAREFLEAFNKRFPKNDAKPEGESGV